MASSDSTTKQCRGCGIDKPHNEFHKHKKEKDGLYYLCKQCKAEKYGRRYVKPVQDGFKRCSLCEVEKPATLEFFSRATKEKSGLTSRCKQCRSKAPHIRFIPLVFFPDAIGYQLGRERITVVDDIDADLLAYFWWLVVTDDCEYAVTTLRNMGNLHLRLHRLVMGRVLGRPLEDTEHVDHKDRNGLNNRRDNLRLATPAQNKLNQKLRSDNKSGFKGVHRARDCNRWRAVITYRDNGEKITLHLGWFPSPEEAYAAYCEAAVKYHGEFVRLK